MFRCNLDGKLRATPVAIASSRGKTPERAKKQTCMTVLIRPPIPASRAAAGWLEWKAVVGETE